MPNWTPRVTEGLVAPAETAPPFEARLEADGVNVVVGVPAAVSTWFAGAGPIPVQGHLDEVAIEATLMPAGGGRHRLFLNGEMRDAADLHVGDVARIHLWRDEMPREMVVPDDLAAALRVEGLLESFEAWPRSHQRDYVLAIEDAKRPTTRERRIRRTVDVVRAAAPGRRRGQARRETRD